MKLSFEGKREWLTRAPVLAIAGFSIFVLVQNGCANEFTSTAPDGGGAGDDAAISGCFAGETPTKVGSQTLCCSGTPPTLVCHGLGSRLGDPCTPSSYPASQQTVDVTLDVCVTDSCDGDHTPTTFDAKVIATTTSLTCTNGALVANGADAVHEVDRACLDVAPLSCPNTTYSYAYGGYVSGYGVSYYGGQELRRRDVGVISSTCSSATSGAQPCDAAGY
ncbi:MAG: hypothetical protein ABI183_17715 [Polyangiaceae bacterium]